MLKRGIVLLAFVGAAVASAACGEVSSADPTPVQTWMITPASGGQAATPTAAAEEPTTQPSGQGEPGAGALTLVGVNSVFEQDELEAPAGSVTIAFDNRDGGIPHNVHVFAGSDASGESVGETELDAGPASQTLTLDLAPGEYFYQCDAHPATMKGTLRVS